MNLDRDQLVAVLHEQGLAPGSDIHGWRCYHPGWYPGYCTCAEEVADAVLAAEQEAAT